MTRCERACCLLLRHLVHGILHTKRRAVDPVEHDAFRITRNDGRSVRLESPVCELSVFLLQSSWVPPTANLLQECST